MYWKPRQCRALNERSPFSSSSSITEGGECQIEASLALVKSTLKTAINEARTVRSKSKSNILIMLLDEIYDAVTSMLSKMGKLRTPLLLVVKKLKGS